MARKVFISFLGATNYSECYYIKKEGELETFVSNRPLRFIQEATLDYLEKDEKWTANDIALILLTEKAEKANWEDNIQTDKETNETIFRKGLRRCLEERDSLIEVRTINNLKTATDEKDLWAIFTKIFDTLNHDEYRSVELYFDLTQSFRYLPMLFLVLTNYLKFMLEIKVKSITYGNFEGRDETTNKAPILDLLPISSLQDWTFAAASYKNNGLADRLCELADTEIRNERRINVDARNNEAVKALQNFMKHLKENSLSHRKHSVNPVLPY